MNRNWMPIVCLGLLLILMGEAFADGIMLNGLSPRSIGRGGTNLGFSDNGAILCDNPAAMVNIDGQRMIDLGVDMILTDLDYSNPRNAGESFINLCPLPQVALLRKSADGNWAYGVGLFVPAGFSGNYSLVSTVPVSGPQQYRSFGMLAKILPGVAYRATDRLSIGATLGVGFNHVELKGPYYIQGSSIFHGVPTLMGVRENGATLIWSAGLQYLLTDATTLGLAYQSESRFKMSGDASVTIPSLMSSDFDAGMDITWPQTLGLGVRHELCPHRIISADVIWTRWSTAFNNFNLRLTNPSNPFFPAALNEQVPLHWSDGLSVRLGYERVLTGGQILRLGYCHCNNPIPKETLTPYIQGIAEHAFSAGYGFLYRRWNVDLAYMYSFSPEITVGASDFIGGDFDGGVHQAQAHCLSLSLMRQY
ncbi:MAG: outer membrane protein transport protein [Pirellulales bacterium]|nr:outer membrane protein transport protein [Pirellulales bacterium]